MDSKQYFYELGKAIYKLDNAYSNFAKKSQVYPSLMWILYALNDGNMHTQIEICKNWDLPKSTVNTIIKDLKAKDLIILKPIKGKKREMYILLTNKGEVYAEKLLSKLYDIEKRIFDKLNQEQLNCLDTINFISVCLNENIKGD